MLTATVCTGTLGSTTGAGATAAKNEPTASADRSHDREGQRDQVRQEADLKVDVLRGVTDQLPAGIQLDFDDGLQSSTYRDRQRCAVLEVLEKGAGTCT